MSQSDQVVQNATFPSVRADINDNLAALFSQSSGPSAPSTTVAFQPWVDTSTSPPEWKVRNAANTGWITVGVLDPSGFGAGGVTPIANGGTGETTASGAINALVPDQSGNGDYFLQTNGTSVLWAAAAAGMTMQIFTSSGTYTRPTGKSSFLVICCGGGGGSGGARRSTSSGTVYIAGAGGGGTGFRLYTASEVGSTAAVTVGAGGSGGTGAPTDGGSGGTSSFDPIGSGVTLSATGGTGSTRGYYEQYEPDTISTYGTGGSFTNAQFGSEGEDGYGSGGVSWDRSDGGRRGGFALLGNNGADGWDMVAYSGSNQQTGDDGGDGKVIILEF